MYAHFNLRKAPKRKDLGIASKVSPVNLIVLVSLIRIPQFSLLYLIEPKFRGFSRWFGNSTIIILLFIDNLKFLIL